MVKEDVEVWVCTSETEMMSDGGLKWDRGLKQLWMGDVSELNGIKMNVMVECE